jgi:RimJ/RimL family protein N-acetyltransferase
MLQIRPLAPSEWLTLRDIRLTALRESPRTFLSTYERERGFEDEHWRAEFDRGDWNVGFYEGEPIGLIGVTRDKETAADACYLEYMWVAPEHRRHGIALQMIKVILDRLAEAGVRTVLLWVLDGNEVAIGVYERSGFVRTNHCQPARPGRTEELLRLELG